MSSTATLSQPTPPTVDEQAAKRRKMDSGSSKVIGTHNGTFHCDEALAVYLLRLTETYAGAGLKRTRDPAVLATCDIVVDVGATYDPAAQRYDHHQRGFEEVFVYGGHNQVKLSSAGLVYKHFGKEIVQREVGSKVGEEGVERLWLKMYKEFIEAIDANDNGIPAYPSSQTPLYRSSTDLPSRVSHLNPAWNQPMTSTIQDSQFAKASELTGSEFLQRLHYYADAWLPAREIVVTALQSEASKSVDPAGRVLVFEGFAPWKEHLFEIEADLQQGEKKALYVLYPDETAGNWRIQAVPVSSESFESRKALPEVWRGVRDEELSKVSGIEGGIFVHASGFIGGNQTKEGVIQMAKKALEL